MLKARHFSFVRAEWSGRVWWRGQKVNSVVNQKQIGHEEMNCMLMKQVNDLELSLWEKMDLFWQRIFIMQTAYLAAIIPIAVKDMSGAWQGSFALLAIVSGVISLISCIPMLGRGLRMINQLVGYGKSLVRSGVKSFECNPLTTSSKERFCEWTCAVMGVVSLICLLTAMVLHVFQAKGGQ